MRIQKSRKNHAPVQTLMLGGIAAIAVCAAGQAQADVTDQLLDQLKAKGVLTTAEYAKLKQRHAAELKPHHTVETVSAPPPGKHHVTKDDVVIVPDDRYVTRLDKGVGLHIGQVDVKVSGILSFFSEENFKTRASGSAVVGGVNGNVVGLNSMVNASNSIRSGLLPSEIAVNLSTNQEGIDLSTTFGVYVSGNNGAAPNGPGNPTALGSSGIDFRQVFGTVGTPAFGTVKIGRDLGLFGGDAILNDATLFGAGSALLNAAPTNTSLGRIGVGYVYADWIPQLTYTSPDWNGFTASAGIFTPYDATNIFTTAATTGTLSGHDQPQIQGQLHYKSEFAPGAKLFLWTDAVTQQFRANVGDNTLLVPGASARAWGFDGGAKVDVGPTSVLAYGYYGQGLGATGLFAENNSLDGEMRKSYGGYAQGTWNLTNRFLVGASWGISALQSTSFDLLSAYNPFLLRSNASYIGFARYKLTDWMNIQAEYIHNIAKNQSGGTLQSDELAVGTAWFF